MVEDMGKACFHSEGGYTKQGIGDLSTQCNQYLLL